MDNFRIIVLALILFSVAAIPGSAMVTDGVCSGEMVYLGATCTAFGFRVSDAKNFTVIYIHDIDDSVPPYQAWIKISSYWDEAGVFGYSETGLQVGNTYTYYNPSDSNDFVRFTIDSIIGGGDIHAVEFGNIDYQQTSYVGSGGSDSNSGKDTSHKWASVAKAAEILTDGEDVIVGSGTYLGFYWIDTGFGITTYNGIGLSNAPIIFKGDGSFPIVTTAVVTYPEAMIINNPQYIDISGFAIKDYGGSINGFAIGFSHLGSGAHDLYIHDNIISTTDVAHYAIMNNYIDISDDNIEFYNNIISSPKPIAIMLNSGSGSGNYIYNNTILDGLISTNTNTVWIPYKNGIGNYYAEYTGVDNNGDKVGDIPQEAGYTDDAYPKMDRESGYVKYLNGSIVNGAAISQIGATYRNTTSDANGYYALSTIGRDTVTLFAQKNSSFGNATVTYDSSNANITIGESGYNNTNTIIFSSDSNPANEINHSAIDTDFWANVWKEDYDTFAFYRVRMYYPAGDLKDTFLFGGFGAPYSFPVQNITKVNSNEDYGYYLFNLTEIGLPFQYASNSILIHNASDVNDSQHNCDCIDHCTPGYFVSTRFCINPYADYASMYFSSDLSGLNKITSAYFNRTVYLQISHLNGDYANYSYNISILKPDNSPFYNWTTTTEYGYASWYTPSIAAGTWTINFIRKNISNSSELIMNTTSLYLSDEGTPPPVILSSISGYVREAGSLNAIYQASVVAGSYSASTNAVGYYNLTNMLNGNYTVTASKTGYNSSSINKVINNASFTNVNFLLNCTGACPTPTPTGTPTVTPTPTGTGGGITPGSTTDATIASNFWTMLFIVLCLYGVAFFWTIGDKE